MTPSAPSDTEAPAPAPTPIGLAPGVPLEAAGQDAAKYGSTNPVVRRLLDRWMGRLKGVIGPIEGTVVDIGIGEGLCLERVLRPVDGAVVPERWENTAVTIAEGPAPWRVSLLNCIAHLDDLDVAPLAASGPA